MPTWPDGVTLVTIRHTPVTTGGRIFPGSSVTARASERLWTDDGSILPADAATTVQADGSWEIQLPAVDTGIRPEGAAYRLTEHVPGAQGRHVWVAPMSHHAPGPVDLVDVLSPQPKPGGGITIQTGPATDPSMAQIAGDPDSLFHAQLMGTIATEVDQTVPPMVPPLVAEALNADAGLGPTIETAVEQAAAGLDIITHTAAEQRYARDHVFDAAKYGAGAAQTWTVNRDAINAAIDAAHAAGGGVVLLPPGDVTVKGIVQRSRVDLRFQGTTLVHPDGDSGSIITTETITTTGSIATDSGSLTVADATGIEVGAVVAVAGAGGRNEAAIWALASAVTSSQTTGITLDGTNGLFAGGGHLIVGQEVIAYTGLSGTTLTGVTRAALGTTATSHSSGAWIAQAARLYAQVEAKSGNTLTLSEHALVGVTGAGVDAGPAYPAISGGARFYGNRPDGGASSTWYPVDWNLTGGGVIDSITAERCEAALMLGRGTTATQVGTITAHDCGNAPVKGSAVWMFRGASNNHIASITATGPDTYTGLYIDDRTSTASEYDGPCMDNTVGSVTVHRPFTGSTSPGDGIGLNITGSGRNIIGNLNVDGLRFPIVIAGQSQNQRPDGSVNPWTYGNLINGGVLVNCHRAWSVTAPGNTIVGVYWESVQGALPDEPAHVTKVAVSESSGAAPTTPILFPDGSKTAPSVTFANDPDSGFYRVTSGDFALSSNGEWVFRIRPNDVMLNDGMNLQVGTGTGTRIGAAASQKLGFFGQTPVTRRPGLGTIAADADLPTVIEKLNQAMIGLRELGLFDA